MVVQPMTPRNQRENRSIEGNAETFLFTSCRVEKINIYSFLFVLSILMISSLLPTGWQGSSPNNYNEHPDVSRKVIGSQMSLIQTIPVKSLDPLVGWADLIVIGQVTSDGVDTSESMAFPNQEIANKIGIPIKVGLSRSAIKIERILYGESASDEISIVQMGSPGNDQGETKVKKGDRMLFIMKQHQDATTDYSSVSAESGLFIIEKGNKILSMSDNLVLAKYDGTHLSLLERDLQKAIEIQKLLPKNP